MLRTLTPPNQISKQLIRLTVWLVGPKASKSVPCGPPANRTDDANPPAAGLAAHSRRPSRAAGPVWVVYYRRPDPSARDPATLGHWGHARIAVCEHWRRVALRMGQCLAIRRVPEPVGIKRGWPNPHHFRPPKPRLEIRLRATCCEKPFQQLECHGSKRQGPSARVRHWTSEEFAMQVYKPCSCANNLRVRRQLLTSASGPRLGFIEIYPK